MELEGFALKQHHCRELLAGAETKLPRLKTNDATDEQAAAGAASRRKPLQVPARNRS